MTLARYAGGCAAFAGALCLTSYALLDRADARVLFPEPQPRSLLGRLSLDAGTDASGPKAPVFALEIGGITPVQPGQLAGYGITIPTRGTYRFVWTGSGDRTSPGYKKFTGSLTTSGQFLRVVPGCAADACALEPGDVVSKSKVAGGGERIDWDTSTLDGLDGFDVEITMDAEPLHVDPQVEGMRKPSMVFFRAWTTTSPSAIPFGVTSP